MSIADYAAADAGWLMAAEGVAGTYVYPNGATKTVTVLVVTPSFRRTLGGAAVHQHDTIRVQVLTAEVGTVTLYGGSGAVGDRIIIDGVTWYVRQFSGASYGGMQSLILTTTLLPIFEG